MIELLKVIIPLLQSLIWPIFIAILLIKFKNHAKTFLNIFIKRFEDGDEVTIGSMAIKQNRKILSLEEPTPIDENSEEYPIHYKASVYLWHTASSLKMDMHDLTERSQIQVVLDTDDIDIVNNIKSVKYYLHPTFKDNNTKEVIKEITNKDTLFLLKFRAWGSFNLKAAVYFTDYKEPLVLYRYINLHTF